MRRRATATACKLYWMERFEMAEMSAERSFLREAEPDAPSLTEALSGAKRSGADMSAAHSSAAPPTKMAGFLAPTWSRAT
jgi:hypothetical protein